MTLYKIQFFKKHKSSKSKDNLSVSQTANILFNHKRAHERSRTFLGTTRNFKIKITLSFRPPRFPLI